MYSDAPVPLARPRIPRRAARPGRAGCRGTYGEQLLTGDASKTSARDVVFRPAPRARVRLDDVRFGRWAGDVGASHVTLSGMTLTDGVSLNRVSDVTLRSMRIEEGFVIRGSRGIRFSAAASVRA